MPKYIFRGTLTKRGVEFYIEAPDAATATARAAAGWYEDYDTSVGETVDWKIDPTTCAEDEG